MPGPIRTADLLLDPGKAVFGVLDPARTLLAAGNPGAFCAYARGRLAFRIPVQNMLLRQNFESPYRYCVSGVLWVRNDDVDVDRKEVVRPTGFQPMTGFLFRRRRPFVSPVKSVIHEPEA